MNFTRHAGLSGIFFCRKKIFKIYKMRKLRVFTNELRLQVLHSTDKLAFSCCRRVKRRRNVASTRPRPLGAPGRYDATTVLEAAPKNTSCIHPQTPAFIRVSPCPYRSSPCPPVVCCGVGWVEVGCRTSTCCKTLNNPSSPMQHAVANANYRLHGANK